MLEWWQDYLVFDDKLYCKTGRKEYIMRHEIYSEYLVIYNYGENVRKSSTKKLP